MGRSPESATSAYENAMKNQLSMKQQMKWFKIDVVNRVHSLKDFDFSQKMSQQIGERKWFYGIALDWNTGWVFLPEEVWANNIVDGMTDVLRWDNLVSYMVKKQENEQKGDIAWTPLLDSRNLESTKVQMDLFYTTSHWIDLSASVSPPQIESLYHGHQVTTKEDISSQLLDHAANAAGDYLVRSTKADGKMVYLFNPRTGIEPDDYNLTRHAGTVFAMARLFHQTKDPLLLDRMRLALNWLLKEHLEDCRQPFPKKNDERTTRRCVVEDSSRGRPGTIKVAKLGVNSLTLLAISEFVASSHASGEDITVLKYYIEVARDIKEYIQGAQNPDGSFVQKIQHQGDQLEVDRSFFVRYYQGEAIFALTRYFYVSGLIGLEQHKNELEGAEAAARYIVDNNWDVPDDEFVDDHWLMYGLAELHRCGRHLDSKLVRYAMRTVNWVAEGQNKADTPSSDSRYADEQDWVGIFYGSTSAASTATKSEGLCAIYDVAVAYHQHDYLALISNAIIDSARYQLKTQFGPGLAMYFQDPARLVGGIRKGLDSLQMRNDYTQHNLSSFLCVAQVLAREATTKKPIGEHSQIGSHKLMPQQVQ